MPTPQAPLTHHLPVRPAWACRHCGRIWPYAAGKGGRLMTEPFIVGDPVTVLPPYDSDPILVAMQRHATIAEIRPEPGPDGSVYMFSPAPRH